METQKELHFGREAIALGYYLGNFVTCNTDKANNDSEVKK